MCRSMVVSNQAPWQQARMGGEHPVATTQWRGPRCSIVDARLWLWQRRWQGDCSGREALSAGRGSGKMGELDDSPQRTDGAELLGGMLPQMPGAVRVVRVA